MAEQTEVVGNDNIEISHIPAFYRKLQTAINYNSFNINKDTDLIQKQHKLQTIINCLKSITNKDNKIANINRHTNYINNIKSLIASKRPLAHNLPNIKNYVEKYYSSTGKYNMTFSKDSTYNLRITGSCKCGQQSKL